MADSFIAFKRVERIDTLNRFIRLGIPAGQGAHNERHAGSGSLMRPSPIAIFGGWASRRGLANQQDMQTPVNQLVANASEFLATLLAEAGRLVDLLLVTRAHSYHRDQRGRRSIEAVLPTIAAYLTYSGLEVKQGRGTPDAPTGK